MLIKKVKYQFTQETLVVEYEDDFDEVDLGTLLSTWSGNGICYLVEKYWIPFRDFIRAEILESEEEDA